MIDFSYYFIIVTPVFEDFEASARLVAELSNQFGQSLFIVAVDDGSVKAPLDVSILSSAGVAGVVLQLCRNVGHQRALAIGLQYVAEHMHPHQVVVTMDSDGEDIPSTIPALLDALQDPEFDVVVSQRGSRFETLKFKIFYAFYKWIFRLMTGRKINFGNFMALKYFAVQRLTIMHELPIHIAGTVLSSKLRIKSIPINRGPRYAGQSKMNFIGLALHGFKALMIFAEDVLVRVGIFCGIIASLSCIGGCVAIILKLAGMSTPGWFSISFGVLILIFLQTGALALMTLMLTGLMRNAPNVNLEGYKALVAGILPSFPHGRE
jgi:glycosyltransferase involved in cell wall biosynthesis